MPASWVMMSGVESRPPASPGLRSEYARGARFRAGLGLGLVLVSAVAGNMALAGWLTFSEWAPSGISASASTAYVTVLLSLAAAFEELAVRGHLSQVAARAGGLAVAVGATALVFA